MARSSSIDEIILPPLDADQCYACSPSKYTEDIMGRHPGVVSGPVSVQWVSYCTKCVQDSSYENMPEGYMRIETRHTKSTIPKMRFPWMIWVSGMMIGGGLWGIVENVH